MPKPERIVINTGPIISIIAALDNLEILQNFYQETLVPFEVCREIEAGGKTGFAVEEFKAATWLNKLHTPVELFPALSNSLDRGEAEVIQVALNEGITTVCIDENVGRRIARLWGLEVTGTLGIMVRAKKEGYLDSVSDAIQQMETKGVWLSLQVKNLALRESGEKN